ncbi:MAG: polysaccharide deacetylase family protein [Actinobacteria bacterium]|nr:polysaccharide deacetylase family protein [Actinomycetota bacterium]
MSPALSVVIPTFNRRERLRGCLQALERQTQDPASFEVVIADDGSTDGTAAAVAALEPPFELRLLELSKRGKSGALNAALEVARGDVCLFVDDDIEVAPAVVSTHLAAHRENPMTLGIGSMAQHPPSDADAYARAQAVRWNARYEMLGGLGVDWADTYGGNFSAPRAALQAVGGFDVGLDAIEDIEIGYRLQRHGCVPRYLPQAEALHHDYKSGKAILAAEESYASFAVDFAERHPETRPRLFGWFGQTGPREAFLRQLLLKARIPPAALVGLGNALPRQEHKQPWYDFIARYAFWFAVRREMSKRLWSEMTRGVPVLMYHAFSDSGEEDRWIAKKPAFERQMRLLKALRYRTISLEQLATALAAGEPLPKRTVVITIDDGYRDNFEIARPVLERLRLGATLFPVSGQLGADNDWNRSEANRGRPMLSPEQLREMAADGFEVGAHTRTHPHLSGLPAETSAEEIAGSRSDLEAVLGAPVRTFAYPYGDLAEETVAAVGAAGFTAACTTENRLARSSDHPLRIPRLEIMGGDNIRNFARKLWFGGR